MADLNASNWSETDGNNNAVSPDGWTSVTMLPNQVEPTARAMMGALKRWYDKVTGTYTSTGASTHYVVTPSNNLYPTAYARGDIWNFYAHQDSAGADDFQLSNVNSLAAKPIYVMTAFGVIAVQAGQIKSGQFARLEYDTALNAAAGGWLLTNPIGPSVGEITTINSTGGTVTLTDTQARVAGFLVTGVLASDLTIVLPSDIVNWCWLVNNQTSGAHNVIIENNTPAGTFTCPAGVSAVATDTVNVAGPTAYALLASPTFTGTPAAPTAALGTSTTQIATTAFAMTMQSPAFTGTPTSPTAPLGTSTTEIATTAFAMTMQSPAFTGIPTAPTAVTGTNTTQIATTSFVNQTAFATALPVQPGTATPSVPVSTNGVVAWMPYQSDTANFLAGVI